MTTHQAASARLTAALWALAGAGRRAPCQNPAYGDLWFSDDQLERRRAIALCRTCPVQQLCRDYRDALDAAPRWRGVNRHHPKHAPGVWGGVDYTRVVGVRLNMHPAGENAGGLAAASVDVEDHRHARRRRAASSASSVSASA